MGKKMLLMMLGFSFVIGGFWALQAQDPQMPRTDPPTVAATTQTDLSGTYTGTFNCDALGLTGDTTLTITGNDFTTADGKTGRIVASTTSGYTAVAMQVGAADPTATPTIVSLRARKIGNRLTLSAVPGAAQKCTFTTSRVARSRRNQTPAATGTDVANPATATPTESPIPEQTPVPSPTPMPTPEPVPSPSPSPSPTPLPSPEPAPTVSPTPIPDPTPTPSPTEPAPSPSPNPSPSPGVR